MVSLGFNADGRRVRRKVSGKTKTEVKDKLKALHSDLDLGVVAAARRWLLLLLSPLLSAAVG